MSLNIESKLAGAGLRIAVIALEPDLHLAGEWLTSGGWEVVRIRIPEIACLAGREGVPGLALIGGLENFPAELEEILRFFKPEESTLALLTGLEGEWNAGWKGASRPPDGYLKWPCSPSELLCGAGAFRGQQELKQQLAASKRQMEKSSQASERRLNEISHKFSKALDSSLDAFCAVDKEGRFLQVSAASKQIWGYDPEELVGTLASNMLVPEDKEKTRMARAAVVAGAPTISFENRYFRKDGSVVHVMWSANWQEEEQGLFCVARDVTEARRAAEALRASEEVFASAFKFATIGMALVGLDGSWLKINRAVCQMLGYTEEELLAKTFQDITHPEDLEADLEQVRRMLEGSIPTYQMEKRYLHKNGGLVWALLSVSLVHDEQGKPLSFISQIQEITARKAQEQIKASFQNLGRRLNSAGNAREAAETIAAVADELFGWDAATLFLYVEEEDMAQALLTVDTIDGVKAERDEGSEKQRPTPLSRRAIEEGALLILRGEDSMPEPDCVMFGDKSRISASLMFAPIRDGLRVVGILTIQSYRRMAYTEADLETLQSLSDYCSGALTRIQAEEKHKASEEGFRALAEAMPQIVWMSRPDGSVTYLNQRWMDYTGMSLEESLGPDAWSKPFHSDHRAVSEEAWKQATQTGAEYQIEAKLRRKDGQYRWMLIRGLPLRAREGEIENWFGTCTDIDDLKRALDAVRASEDRFRLFAKVTSDAIWDWNLETDELWWNEGFTTLFGYEREAVEKTNASWVNRIHPKDRERVVKSIHEAIDGKARSWSGEYDFIRQDGASAFVLDRGHLIRDEAGKAVRMIGGMTDLSARKATEEKLREQAALLDQTNDAILVRGLDHKISFWNKGAEKIYGWTAAEAIGKSVRELVYRDPAELDAAVEKTVLNGVWGGELSHITKSGTTISIYGSWSLLRDQQGKPRSILAINSDITERKKLEQQFLRSQRMESIGTLAGGIAHDLNNVLAPILLSIETLKLGESDEDKRETLEIIEKSAVRGAEMVKQVLSFARGVAGRRVQVEMKEVISHVANIVNETFLKNIKLSTEFGAGLWPVSGDPTQLHQVLINLCVNARDAMPGGGDLRISVENISFSEPVTERPPDAQRTHYVLVKVTDSGTGIQEEALDKIFDPFFTTKELGKGTGLGLSTSQAIVKSHGGFMQVQSAPGIGSSFLIFLPGQMEPDPSPSPAPASGMPRGRGERVLVVDDEHGVRMVAVKTLESFGYKTLAAADGEEALRIYAAQMGEIDLVLTDMMMPMMDGPATIQGLKKLNPEVKIIAASGLHVTETVETARSMGALHFLSKPFTTEELLETVKKALEEKRLARSNITKM